jgi:hypothetical protein
MMQNATVSTALMRGIRILWKLFVLFYFATVVILAYIASIVSFFNFLTFIQKGNWINFSILPMLSKFQ